MRQSARRTVQLALIASVLNFSAFPETSAVADDKVEVIEVFDVARHGDFLLVPVTIDGKSYKFAVDTGSTRTVLDSEFRPTLTATQERVTVNGKAKVPVYVIPVARLGKVGLPLNRKAVCVDLAPLRESSGREIAGLLGMDFLDAYGVRIDFDAGRLSILRSGPKRRPGGLTLSRDRVNRPTLPGNFGAGEDHHFLVDSASVGAGGCSVVKDVFDRLLERDQVALLGASATEFSVDGIGSRRVGLVRRFRVRDFEHEQLAISEGDVNAVGLAYLARYVVTFDFPNRAVYLEKGKRYSKRQQFDMAGITLSRKNGRTVVDNVCLGRSAHNAGLRVGDRLVRVDDRDVNLYSLFELEELFSCEGRDVRLVFDRGSAARTTSLRLEVIGDADVAGDTSSRVGPRK